MTRRGKGLTWLEPPGFGSPRIAILCPNTLRVGSSNLGLHTLFRTLNRIALVDVFFSDDRRSLRLGKTLGDFDLALFTIPYELDYPNAVRMLLDGGLQPLASEREKRPLVVAGGMAPSANPDVLAPFVDAVAVGESEAIVPGLLECVRSDKEASIEALSEKPWAYVTGRKESAVRARVRDLSRTDSYSAFLSPEGVFKNMLLLEATRGCPQRCRFCLTGFTKLPLRFVDLDWFLEVLEGSSIPELRALGLVGSAIGDHPNLQDFLDRLPERIQRVSVSSLKMDAVRPELLSKLKRRRLLSLTLAPECGDARLRAAVNKPFSNDDVLEAVDAVIQARIPRLKLYFMVGLPGETEADVRAIGDLLRRIRERFPGQLSATVTPFVPKPGTPFQNEPFTRTDEIDRRWKTLDPPHGVRIRLESRREAVLEALLSRGDRGLARAIRWAAESRSTLRTALKELEVDVNRYLYDPGYLREAPFHRVDFGVSREFIEAELERSRRGEPTPSCPPHGCSACGICG
jgi:radical SAM superfamily enzyme YgiQ (UPF0313 family)